MRGPRSPGSRVSLSAPRGAASGGTVWLGLAGGELGSGKTKNTAEISGGRAPHAQGSWAPRAQGASN